MDITGRKSLEEHETAAVRDLFDRIVAAEVDKLTDEQKADPRAYLVDTWRQAAETVMRPLHRISEMAESLREQRERHAQNPDDWMSGEAFERY